MTYVNVNGTDRRVVVKLGGIRGSPRYSPYCDPCLAVRRIRPTMFNHTSLNVLSNGTLHITLPEAAEVLRSIANISIPLASLVTMVHVPEACGPYYLHALCPYCPITLFKADCSRFIYDPVANPYWPHDMSAPERIEVHPALELARWHPELLPLAPPTIEAVIVTHHVTVAVPVGETFGHNDEESLRSEVKPSGDGDVSEYFIDVVLEDETWVADIASPHGEPGVGMAAARRLLVGAGRRERLEP